MIKYIVEVIVDAKKQLNEIGSSGKKLFTQIKGWDGESPLYGVGKAYSMHLTPEIGMALQFSKERDAERYAHELAGYCIYTVFNPVLSTKVLKVDVTPSVIECTRTIEVNPKRKR